MESMGVDAVDGVSGLAGHLKLERSTLEFSHLTVSNSCVSVLWRLS